MGNPNIIFEEARHGFAIKRYNWVGEDVRAYLWDLGAATSMAQVTAISASTATTPAVITATGHGLVNGDVVAIVGHQGNTNCNGRYIVLVGDAAGADTANKFRIKSYLDDATLINGNAAGATTGHVVNITDLTTISDITAGLNTSTVLLANKTSTKGVLNANPADFGTVSNGSGVTHEVVLLKHESTGDLMFFISDAINLPVTPNGGNITVNWNTGRNKIIRL